MEPPKRPKLRQRVGAWLRRKREVLPWVRKPKPIGKKPLPPNRLRVLFYCVEGMTLSEVAGKVYRHWQANPPGFPVIVDAVGHIMGIEKGLGFMEQVRRADVVIPLIGGESFGIKLDHKGRMRGRRAANEIRRKRLDWFTGLAPGRSRNLDDYKPSQVARQIEAWVGARYALPGQTYAPVFVGKVRRLGRWE